MDKKLIQDRNVLLLVTGKTPQVVTETLCALITQKDGFIPTEIHVVTTDDGYSAMQKGLFDSNVLNNFCDEFQNLMGNIKYKLSDYEEYEKEPNTSRNFFIHKIRDKNGDVLNDIRNSQDSEDAGNVITEVIRGICEDPNAKLHVSIAGGRKTMGFYAGHALGLFGRKNSCRLSHVLASKDFEDSKKYYPTLLELKESPNIIELAYIPVVLMGNMLPNYFNRNDFPKYSDVVARIQKSLKDKYPLSFDFKNRAIICNEISISFSPELFAGYLTLLKVASSSAGSYVEINLDFIRTYILVLNYIQTIKKDKKVDTYKDLDFGFTEYEKEGQNKYDGSSYIRTVNLKILEEQKTIINKFMSTFKSIPNANNEFFCKKKELIDNCRKIIQIAIAKIREGFKKPLTAHEFEIFNIVSIEKGHYYSFNFGKLDIDIESTHNLIVPQIMTAPLEED